MRNVIRLLERLVAAQERIAAADERRNDLLLKDRRAREAAMKRDRQQRDEQFERLYRGADTS